MTFDPGRSTFDGRMRQMDRTIRELVRRPGLSGSGAQLLRPSELPPPKAPLGVVVDENVPYLLADGATFMSRVVLSWSPVTQNTSNVPIAVTQYEVWVERDGAPRTRVAATTTTSIRLDFPSGLPVRAFVRAGTIRNLWSAFSSHVDIDTALDLEPMDAPTTPALTSNLGAIIVDWDGLLTTGAPPAKFRNIVAEISTSSSGPWMRVGTPFAANGTTISGEPVGATRWVRLIARDALGIESPASAAASVTVVGVGAGQIEVGAITLTDLDATITDAIDEALTGDIDPNRIIASSISTTKLLVSSLTNLLEDPGFETNSAVSWNNGTAGVTKSTTTPRSGAYCLRIVSAAAGFEATRHAAAIAVQPGEEYFFSAWLRMEGAGVGVDNAVELLVAYGATAASTTTTDSIAESPPLGATYVRVDGSWLVPDGVFFVRPGLYMADTTPGNVYLVDDMLFIKRAAGELIVDGAITAGKLAVGSVTAEAIEAGAVSADALQAGAVTAEKIAADAVTANAIAAGAITANAIAAGEIETYHLSAAVGASLDISSNESINLIVGDISTNASAISGVAGTVAEMGTYYQFGGDEATISSPGSIYELALSPDGIEIRESGVAVSTWDAGQMIVPSAVVERVVLGNHQIEKYGDGTVVRAL